MDQHKISLNVHLQVPSTSANDGSHTPNTPEILNTIVNMTSQGPFANEFMTANQQVTQMQMPQVQAQPEPVYTPVSNVGNSESLSYTDISMETTSSNLSSPSTPNSSLSVQAYTSQFIKEGLRIKMRQRIGSGSSTSSTMTRDPGSPGPSTSTKAKGGPKRLKMDNLTPDDVVRRQRRRERNKIAATKCRNKKKARTVNLMKESEILDAQNKALKLEISKLESEKDHLMDILQQHEPCAKKLKETYSEFRVPLPPASSQPNSSMIPMIKVTAPPQAPEPPSFAEAIRMVSEVKEEEDPDDSSYYFGDEFYNQNPFLAKRNLGQTYLDLDSRCIAL